MYNPIITTGGIGLRQPVSAEAVFEAIKKQAQELRDKASPKEVIAMNVILYEGSELQVHEYGYVNSEMLLFRGTVNNKNLAVLLHPSSLQITFMAVSQKDKKRREPIGFGISPIQQSPPVSEDKESSPQSQ